MSNAFAIPFCPRWWAKSRCCHFEFVILLDRSQTHFWLFWSVTVFWLCNNRFRVNMLVVKPFKKVFWPLISHAFLYMFWVTDNHHWNSIRDIDRWESCLQAFSLKSYPYLSSERVLRGRLRVILLQSDRKVLHQKNPAPHRRKLHKFFAWLARHHRSSPSPASPESRISEARTTSFLDDVWVLLYSWSFPRNSQHSVGMLASYCLSWMYIIVPCFRMYMLRLAVEIAPKTRQKPCQSVL